MTQAPGVLGRGFRAIALIAALALAGVGLAQTVVEAPPGQSVDGTGALVPPRRAEAGVPATIPAQGPVNGTAFSTTDVAQAPATLDFAAWEKMAVRAEAAIGDNGSTSVALEHLRSLLVDWREAFLGAENANAARIATLRTQIAALGAAPVEGEAEAEEIAKRRSELTDQLVRLQAPGIAAEEAYRRADGLIREIDRMLRDRQADELLRLWPAPINPANWPAGVVAASEVAVTLYAETAAKAADPAARAKFADNLPLVILALLFAGLVLWRGRSFIDAQVNRLRGESTARGRRIWEFLASLGLIIVPTLGVEALSVALEQTAMLGVIGKVIVGTLPAVGFTVFASIWLGGRVFPSTHPRRGEQGTALLGASERRAGGRFIASSFGVLLGFDALRRTAADQVVLSEAATSVLTFPIIVIAGLLLFRMGQVMRGHAQAESSDEQRSFSVRMISLLASAAMVIGIAGPLLAAVGYVSAAVAMVFPAIFSLGLVGLLFVLQRLISDIYALVIRSAIDESDALVPVLAGFVLTLATLPLFALIWGARTADILELWTKFREGFTLGETKVSPIDFLWFGVIFGLGYGLTRLLQGALKTTVLPRTGLDQGGQNAIVSGLGYVGIFLAALIAINSTGIDLSGLAIVAGALSVGIGFGLQNIVSNFVSGIILLIERPVSEGDWIEVGGVQGIVKSISVRSTRIQTFDRSDVIVPNTDLVAGRVTNWTRYNLSGRLIVPVTVPLTSDSRQVARILREIAEAQPLAVLNPPPLVLLMGFTGEAMQFEIRAILRDVNFNLSVRSEINHQIAQRFAAEGVLFTNAQRDFLAKQAEVEATLALGTAELAAHEAAVAALLGPLPAGSDAGPDPLRPVAIPDALDQNPTKVPRI